MSGLVGLLQESFPGKPKFTENDIEDLTGKVMIVTGSNTGLGKEIAQILYSKNAKVYMMARSEEKTKTAIASIKAAFPNSTGEMIFLPLDLSDLQTIKASAEPFLQREKQLHILFNNAGVGYPGKGSQSKQGYELQLGVNCIGTFAFTKVLTPILISTAKTSPTNSVRVVWVSSSAAEAVSPKNFVENLSGLEKKSSFNQYCISKLGGYLYATEFAARHKKDGVISVSLNPGNLDSDFWRTQGTITTAVLRKTVLYPTIYGAYTALFSGLSPEVTLEKSGSFIVPWGRLWKVSKDMINASKTKLEGGNGIAQQFWDWSENETSSYL